MDTIIVVTDFSKNCGNALNYAVDFGRHMQSKIVLLYIYPQSGEQKITEERLLLMENEIRSSTNVPIELVKKRGTIENVIIETSFEQNAEIIIIGMGEAGILNSPLGSTAMDVIKKLTIPVLIVPPGASFTVPSKIVFATDYVELKNHEPIHGLLNFVNFFRSKLYIVNIMSEDEKTSSKKVASIIKVKKMVSKINHSFHYPYNDNVVDGINEFTAEMNAEIVAMIPHKHTFFHKLLNLSNTKKMIYNSHVPILILPENITVKDYPDENEFSFTKTNYNIYAVYDTSNIEN